MAKILQINGFIGFTDFKSFLYEKMVENYFKLGNIDYYNYREEGIESFVELQRILNEFNECLDNYSISYNYKESL